MKLKLSVNYVNEDSTYALTRNKRGDSFGLTGDVDGWLQHDEVEITTSEQLKVITTQSGVVKPIAITEFKVIKLEHAIIEEYEPDEDE